MPQAQRREVPPPTAEVSPDLAPRLELLGGARLLGPSGVARLERRPAALLAYLALEGPTPRQRLAGLLWPEGGESQARANLRQLLKRLRGSGGETLVVGESVLSLGEAVAADAALLERLAFEGRHREALELTGELLGGLEYDDAPELEEWLIGARETLDARRRDAAAAESERLTGEGDLSGALSFARLRLALEPLSEEAHRRVMRLHYLLGDRGAALAAFEHLRSVLRDELGAEPLPETANLAREIERGAGVKPAAAPKPSLPLAALRPPVLAGRAAEWGAMEAAWEGRQFIFVSGEAGSGKSRLALDFAASKGHVTTFSARPGDAAVPYAAAARTARRMLENRPGLKLPGWVRLELARLLPELGEAGPPLEGEAGRLRLYEAVAEAFRLAHPGGGCYVSDDWQFADPASVELSAYACARAFEHGVGTVVAFRSKELPAASAEVVRSLVAAGALHLELAPLGEAEVGEVLTSLGVPGLEGYAAQVARHTGGNPQFVLETVRHLVETGQLERGVPARLPPSGRVRELTARRLERLSSGARDLARAAAVLGADLTAARAARVLGVGPLALAEPWAELEAAQVLKGETFSHDLVFEAALASIPEAVRRPLHRAAAEALEATRAAPARVAEHWLEAGEPLRAAPRLLEAGRAAELAYRLPEAAALFGRAAGLLEAAGEREAAFGAAYDEQRLMARFDAGAGREAAIERLSHLAGSPAQRARTAAAKAELLYTAQRAAEAEAVALAGLPDAAEAGEGPVEADLWGMLAAALWAQDRLEEALAAQRRAHALNEAAGDPARLSESFMNLAVLLDDSERRREAIEHYELALAVRAGSADRLGEVGILNNLAVSQAEVGLGRDSLQTLLRAEALLEGVEGATDLRIQSLTALGTRHFELAEHAAALARFEEALALATAFGFWTLPTVLRSRAMVHLALGRPDLAEAGLAEALARPNVRRKQKIAVLRVRGRLLARGGDPAAALAVYAEAERLAAESVRGLSLWSAWLDRASVSPPEEALPLAARALAAAETHDLPGLAIAARTRIAAALLDLSRFAEARAHAVAAREGLSTHVPAALDRAEVLLTHARALSAAGDPSAEAAFRDADAWLLETAETQVPPEFRASFLEGNPINRALLEAARRAGLGRPADGPVPAD